MRRVPEREVVEAHSRLLVFRSGSPLRPRGRYRVSLSPRELEDLDGTWKLPGGSAWAGSWSRPPRLKIGKVPGASLGHPPIFLEGIIPDGVAWVRVEAEVAETPEELEGCEVECVMRWTSLGTVDVAPHPLRGVWHRLWISTDPCRGGIALPRTGVARARAVLVGFHGQESPPSGWLVLGLDAELASSK